MHEVNYYMNKSPYAVHAQKSSAPSHLFRDCILAFTVGGGICCLGQTISDLFLFLKLDKTSAMGFTSIALIFLSCLLTGIGLYDKLASFAGAGTLVPITGFANAMCSPAIDNKAEGLVLGLGSKIFVICGPVILYGTVLSLVLGITAYFLNLFGIDVTGVV